MAVDWGSLKDHICCISQPFITVTKYLKQFRWGEIYFGSPLQKFQPMVSWLHCYVMRQTSWWRECNGVELLISW
jgi:hypothetical protein